MKNKKPLVYLASPFTEGDQILNLRAHIDMYNRFLDEGEFIPFAPLMAAWAHFVQGRHYEKWMDHDFDMLARCDALFAFDAEVGDYLQQKSKGRDREIDFAIRINIPIYFDINALRLHGKVPF